jgi:DNA-binding NtrC family response regulator
VPGHGLERFVVRGRRPIEIDELLVVVRRALEHQRLRTEHRYLRSERDEQFDNYGIIGKSRPMTRLFQLLETVKSDP